MICGIGHENIWIFFSNLRVLDLEPTFLHNYMMILHHCFWRSSETSSEKLKTPILRYDQSSGGQNRKQHKNNGHGQEGPGPRDSHALSKYQLEMSDRRSAVPDAYLIYP